MINLNATVVGHAMTLTNASGGSAATLPTGSSGVDAVAFTISGADWTGTTMYAVFWQDPAAVYKVAVSSNAAAIPSEVLITPGTVYVALYGDNGTTSRISTNACVFTAEQGALTAETAPAPTPSMFEAAVDAAVDEILETIIDDTLTIEGKAADAKATGDRITNAVLPLVQGESWSPAITVGQSIGTSGATTVNTKRCRTTSLWAAAGARTAIALNSDTYQMSVREYGSGSSISASNYVGTISGGFVNGLVLLPSSAVKFAVAFTRADDAVMTDSDADAIKAALMQYKLTDTTLTASNVPADAKTVGDKMQVNESLINTLFSDVKTSLSYIDNRYVDYTDGVLKVSSSNIVFGGYVISRNTVFRCSDPTYQIAAYYYDGYNGTYTGYTSYSTVVENTIFVPTSKPFVRFVARRTDQAQLTSADKAAIVAAVELRTMPTAPDSLIAPMRTFTRRNNASFVEQFLAVAETYLGQTSIEYDDGNTVFYKSTETHGIDCSTLVNLCLLGYPFQKTPYYTGNYISPTAWVPNSDYAWPLNPLNYKVPYLLDGTGSMTPAKFACQLAKWMYERNWSVSMENGFEDVRPGDVVFWARRDRDSGEWIRPDWWKHINHVGIIQTKEAAPDTYEYTVTENGVSSIQTGTWDKTKYPYKHTIIEAVNASPAPCINSKWLEKGQEDPTNVYSNNVNTVVMIARPDLGALAAAGGGGGGSDNAVLYTAQTLTTAQKQQARQNINAGTYSKAESGIPKTDLAQGVQDSLDLADSALQSHQDISGKADKVQTVTVTTGGAVTQALDAGKIYVFSGSLTSLTLTFNAPATGDLAQYHFILTEGSTAFDPVLPNGVVLPDNHTWEADTRYEVDILDGYAVVVGWAVS